MTVIQNGAFLINYRFTNNIIGSINFFEVNSSIYISQNYVAIFNSFFESFYALVLFTIDIEFSTVLNNNSILAIKSDLIFFTVIARNFIYINTSNDVFSP